MKHRSRKRSKPAVTALARRVPEVPPGLLADVRRLINSARLRVAGAVNSELSWLYWQVGRRIGQDILKGDRADYGQQIVHSLSGQLSSEYGEGFSRTNLFNMVRFAELFPEEKIVHSLSGQLSWTHIRHIIYVEDPLARTFYAEMARLERWSVRTLAERIGSMLFERTAVSKKPEKVIMR